MPPEDFASSQLDVELPPGVHPRRHAEGIAAGVPRCSSRHRKSRNVVESVGERRRPARSAQRAALYVQPGAARRTQLSQKQWEIAMVQQLAQVPGCARHFPEQSDGGGRDIKSTLVGERPGAGRRARARSRASRCAA